MGLAVGAVAIFPLRRGVMFIVSFFKSHYERPHSDWRRSRSFVTGLWGATQQPKGTLESRNNEHNPAAQGKITMPACWIAFCLGR